MSIVLNAKEFISDKHKNLKINYDKVLKKMVEHWQRENFRPKILIHSCCAPCSTTVLDYLASVADVTIYFSNSNIHPRIEYDYRKQVQEDFIKAFNAKTGANVAFMADDYTPQEFLKRTKGLEQEVEGGKRCHVCYEMRLERSVQQAIALGFDYFASALTLSPHKNSDVINTVGFRLEDTTEVTTIHYLPSDFKKNNGYKKSVDMCKEYDIYRQCYCGCVFAAKAQGVDLKATSKHAKENLRDTIIFKQSEHYLAPSD